MQIVKGIDAVQAKVQDEVDRADVDMKSAGGEMSRLADQVKGYIAVMFGPFLLLIAIGGVALGRNRFGRLGGLGALLFGAVSAFLSIVLLSVSREHGNASAGLGLWLAVLASCGAAIGGLLALIKPDRGAF
jgi:hypothetical protein